MKELLARSFERIAEAYEQGRPGYAEAALDAVDLPADAVVLDLAAGTGKLTRQLVARFARVIAVEPLDGMRAVLERVVPEAEALKGSADAIPLEDASVDAVFVGEAFHWFAGDDVLREIARVLRPRGILAILFNQQDGDFEPPLPEAFWDEVRSRRAREAAGAELQLGAVADSVPRARSSRSAETGYPNPVELDRAMILAQVSSWSMIAALPDPDRTRLLAELGELVPDRAYVHRLRTDLFLTRLT